MTDEISHEPALPKDKGGRPKAETIALTKAARARFDTLAAESIEAVFQAVLTAATQDGDMAAAKLLIDRVIPSRRGAPVSFHIRPLKTPEDCALAYADLLDDVGAGRLTPDEAQTISAIVAKRAELFPSVELASCHRRCERWLTKVTPASKGERKAGCETRIRRARVLGRKCRHEPQVDCPSIMPSQCDVYCEQWRDRHYAMDTLLVRRVLSTRAIRKPAKAGPQHRPTKKDPQ